MTIPTINLQVLEVLEKCVSMWQEIFTNDNISPIFNITFQKKVRSSRYSLGISPFVTPMCFFTEWSHMCYIRGKKFRISTSKRVQTRDAKKED